MPHQICSTGSPRTRPHHTCTHCCSSPSQPCFDTRSCTPTPTPHRICNTSPPGKRPHHTCTHRCSPPTQPGLDTHLYPEPSQPTHLARFLVLRTTSRPRR